ncbi:MAG: hypothetical protein V4719_28610 [Planctomycetota bacterium]
MSTLRWASVLGVAALTLGLAPTLASADDVHVKTTPAIIQTAVGQPANVTVQPVQWGVGVGFRGGRWGGPGVGFYAGPRYYGGGYYGGGYYGGGYRGGYGYGPRYYGGYYSYPRYYYPSYGYGYSSYPPYGYYY